MTIKKRPGRPRIGAILKLRLTDEQFLWLQQKPEAMAVVIRTAINEKMAREAGR